MSTAQPDHTHDPALQSWVVSANAPGTDFPIQNLPLGVFTRDGGEPHIGVAIGEMVLDVPACLEAGLLRNLPADLAEACGRSTLNAVMQLGRMRWSELRSALNAILKEGYAEQRKAARCLIPMAAVQMQPPAKIGDYTDFYASIHHATNVGSMFRPDNPLLPNYKYVPIGYHGRSSSIVVSGTPVRRPVGQTKDDPAAVPTFGPSKLLDYELEVGMFVGPGNVLGEPISIGQAHKHMFGLCLLNDWSARDIQKWEYQPLGPFLAKNFATSISLWVVTVDALAPFRVPAEGRPSGDPEPLPYLFSEEDRSAGGFDITLEVLLLTSRMREQQMEPVRISRGNFRHMYWTFAQMLTHHASNGCNLRPGDLLGSGTVSGPEAQSRGCLLELTRHHLLQLPTGEERRFLDDGDEVILRGYCERAGYRRIGFGECRGVVVASHTT